MIITSGKYKGYSAKRHLDKNTRPLTKRIRQSILDNLRGALEGAIIYDIFAGSGIFGVEALSNGASHAVFVDKSKKNCENIKKIMADLKEENFTVINCMFDSIPDEIPIRFPPSFIFLDPPYAIARSKKQAEAIFDSVTNQFDGGYILIFRLFARVPFSQEGSRVVTIGQDRILYIGL